MADMDGELRLLMGSWARQSPLASLVRRAVFIVEQGIPENEEWDDIDAEAVHWVALLDGEPVGCARMTREGKIGRMAVLAGYRGRGIGRQLLEACVSYAVQKQFPAVRLSAQQHALSFYEKQGFEAVGDPHEEVGIPHQWMVRELATAPVGESLTGYMERVRQLLDALPASWVTGTLSELRRQNSGHLYFTLVQTDETGEVAAKCRAIVWRSAAALIEQRFRQATGLSLANNQEVMLKVRAQAHAVHGFSLMVDDIHPEFTVGRLAARLEQIRRQLRAEGLYDRNRQLGLPDDYFRVAVLSPADAAGLGDFRSRADGLMAAGVLRFVYFTATFQGPQTATSMCAALDSIATAHAETPFDAVVIIRGGGSEWDLACLNEMEIARAVCRLPLPVLCGIGHERDSTIIDEIACHRLATPSMVIDFIEGVVMERLLRVKVNLNDIRRLALLQFQRATELARRLREQVTDQAVLQQRTAAERMAHQRALVIERAQGSVGAAKSAVLQSHGHVTERGLALAALARNSVGLLQIQLTERARQVLSLKSAELERLRHEQLPQDVRQRLETAELRTRSLGDWVRSQDPAMILQRGYAIALDEDGLPLTAAAEVRRRGRIRLRLRDGEVPLQPVSDDETA